MKIVAFAKEHPVETGGIVFLGGLVVLFLLGFFKSSSGTSSSAGDPNASAYFAAESAQAAAGDQLQAVQIESQASTAQDLINANASVENNTTWANANYNTTLSNNATTISTTGTNDATAIALAPYGVENNLISTLGSVASLPGQTVTNSGTYMTGGILGIGAKAQNWSYSYLQPNAAAEDAAGLLGSLTTNGYVAGH